MRTLPTTMIRVLAPFAPLFSKRVFQHAQALVAGALLAPGRRTVSSALRAMGLDQEKRFHRYHRVLREALAGVATACYSVHKPKTGSLRGRSAPLAPVETEYRPPRI
jgi:hypothetical protein